MLSGKGRQSVGLGATANRPAGSGKGAFLGGEGGVLCASVNGELHASNDAKRDEGAQLWKATSIEGIRKREERMPKPKIKTPKGPKSGSGHKTRKEGPSRAGDPEGGEIKARRCALTGKRAATSALPRL